MDFICYINIFYRYGKALLEDMAKDLDLTMHEIIVILVISQSEGIVQSYLGKFVAMDKGNFSNFLKKLEDRDLIYREKNKVLANQNQCFLTDKAKDLVGQINEILSSWNENCLEGVDQDERENFFQVSSMISDNLFEELDIKW